MIPPLSSGESLRAQRIRRALEADSRTGHYTEFFAREGKCSVAEAVIELMRLERQGLVVTGRSSAGMTWRYDPR